MSDPADDRGKGAKRDEGVMGNLPATRPSRLSRRARETGAEPAPKPAPARRAAAKRSPAKPAAPKRTPAAGRAARSKADAGATPGEARRPTAIRAGAPSLDRSARKAGAGRATAGDEVPPRQQNPVELATTMVKAAGELAQIGATVAGQAIKRATGKLPRP